SGKSPFTHFPEDATRIERKLYKVREHPVLDSGHWIKCPDLKIYCLFLLYGQLKILEFPSDPPRWTDNSWGPWAIGDHGARVLAQTQKSV
ncbi:unnamed protein product, partial [Staurois parvus]